MSNDLRLFATTDAIDPSIVEITAQDVIDDVLPAYGGLSVFGTGAPFATTPVPVVINPYTAAMPSLNLVSSVAAGQLQIFVDGTYEVYISVSCFDVAAGNIDYIFQIGHNGAPTIFGFRTSHTTIAKPHAGSCKGIIQAVAGDNFVLMASAPLGVQCTVTDATFTARRMGA